MALVLATGAASSSWFASSYSQEEQHEIVSAENTLNIPLAPDPDPGRTQIQANLPKPIPQKNPPAPRKPASRTPQTPLLETLAGEKRESARVIATLSCDDLDRNIREAGLSDMQALVDMIPAIRELQSALRGTDFRLAKEKALELLRLASLLKTDEAFAQYWEKMESADFSEEFKTVLIPAVKEAENLVANDFGS